MKTHRVEKGLSPVSLSLKLIDTQTHIYHVSKRKYNTGRFTRLYWCSSSGSLFFYFYFYVCCQVCAISFFLLSRTLVNILRTLRSELIETRQLYIRNRYKKVQSFDFNLCLILIGEHHFKSWRYSITGKQDSIWTVYREGQESVGRRPYLHRKI